MVIMRYEMIIFDIFSTVLLAVLLFWAVYNVSIIYAGIRSKRKLPLNNDENEEFPKFSIIVPAKDEEVVIYRCLNGLLDLDYPKDKMEIIIVDGDSTDSTGKVCSEFIAKYPEIFKIINEKESKGKPVALNLALPYVTGEIVGTFDADSLPDKEVLRKAASYFNYKQVMAVQGRTYSLNEKSSILTRVAAMEEKAWYQVLISGREKLQLFVPLNGSCQFIRRSVLEELGGWDETCLTEDVELALRLVEKNYLIKYAPDVISGQETPSSLGDLVKQRVRWYRGYMEIALKYGRLLGNINRKTVDAEISLAGPFMMVVSLLSYLNWFFIAFILSDYNPLPNVTGLVIALTAVSLFSIGIALTASEKPIKLRNLLWVPSIYVYWLFQMCIAGWAFLKLVFRRKRVWSKTVKAGSITSNLVAS
jgi:cellulose synthase/poly-beta-1,6-N-acetylglucosamine synthase-like glycosyltransferase